MGELVEVQGERRAARGQHDTLCAIFKQIFISQSGKRNGDGLLGRPLRLASWSPGSQSVPLPSGRELRGNRPSELPF